VTKRPVTPLAPGDTIGILGGGQLGRMTALAAARLGYRCHIFTPEDDSPAAQVSHATTVAEYGNMAALDAFARSCGVVTFEFENIPHESVQRLAAATTVRPGWQALRVAQDRTIEKKFINDLGLKTAPWREARGREALIDAIAAIGRPAVLKTARLGYDGKGQVMIGLGKDLDQAWREMGAEIGILEGFIELEREISVIVARAADGAMAAYPPAENRHAHHILDTTTAPAPIGEAMAKEAVAIAGKLADALDLVGLLAVEMFVTRQGALLVNEVAPRPHNSGHWTIDACPTSQFEQFVRAIAGLPLGAIERHSDAVMKNLIGDEVNTWPMLVAEAGACLHLYGKKEARPGRKMGHVTRLYPKGSLAKKAP
jgi:5-(carboxyamino)imidazole ribonucleotide synthase